MVDTTIQGKVAVRFLACERKYRTDPKTGETTPDDWIEFCRPGQAHIARTWEAVRRLKKDAMLWEALGPSYEAWSKNEEVPEHGTPLAAWAGIVAAQASAFKAQGIRTVEEIAELPDSVIGRINIPGVRGIVEQAKRFLASKDTREVENKLAEKDQEIADLRAKLDNLADMMALRLDEAEAPRRGPGRPRKEQAAAE